MIHYLMDQNTLINIKGPKSPTSFVLKKEAQLSRPLNIRTK